MMAFALIACGKSPSQSELDTSKQVQHRRSTIPVSELHFKDHDLEKIAASLVRKAETRGIHVTSGRSRIEGLVSLEASLGRSNVALERVNRLVSQITANDTGRWAKIRQRADLELSDRDDAASNRVRDVLKRWQMKKTDIAWSHLSSTGSSSVANGARTSSTSLCPGDLRMRQHGRG